jgi:tetratricopeptide (TPR) repeat protein
LQSPAAIEIDEAARELDSELPGPRTRQARRLLADGRPLDAVDLLSSARTLDDGGQLVLAEAYLRADDAHAAALAIAPLVNVRSVRSDVLRTATSIYMTTGDEASLERAVSRLRGQTSGKAKPLADVEMFLGKLYESHRRYPLALRAYENANRALESREALIATARVADAMGNRERALLTYKRLCRADGGEGAACASADALAKPVNSWP